MTEQEKLSLIIEMLSVQQKTLASQAESTAEVLKQMPFDHLQQHDLLRLHLAHIPAPSDHGNHHEFTGALQKHWGTLVNVLVQGIGYAILAVMLLGIGAWVIKTTGAFQQPQQRVEQQNNG